MTHSGTSDSVEVTGGFVYNEAVHLQMYDVVWRTWQRRRSLVFIGLLAVVAIANTVGASFGSNDRLIMAICAAVVWLFTGITAWRFLIQRRHLVARQFAALAYADHMVSFALGDAGLRIDMPVGSADFTYVDLTAMHGVPTGLLIAVRGGRSMLWLPVEGFRSPDDMALAMARLKHHGVGPFDKAPG